MLGTLASFIFYKNNFHNLPFEKIPFSSKCISMVSQGFAHLYEFLFYSYSSHHPTSQIIAQRFHFMCKIATLNFSMASKATTGGVRSSSPPSLQTLCHWSNPITNLRKWHKACKPGEDELHRPFVVALTLKLLIWTVLHINKSLHL